MLYKPKFCCECGTKIERSDWKIWTSRRFCVDCEIDKKPYEWLTKIAAVALALFGLSGVGSFLAKTEKPLNVTTSQLSATNFSKNRQVSGNSNVQPSAQNAANSNQLLNVNQSLKTKSDLKAGGNTPLQSKVLSETKDETSEPVYFCGARTKKGTACSRRVKGGGRCWQHAGQPAMLPPEKLLISQ